ncbi:tRNA lysidine(34) synthetase TilS [Colwelliaceae bacterium BS250]
MTATHLHPLCQQVFTFLSKPCFANKPITIAYSGGVDSQVLLHCASQLVSKNLLNVEIKAVHVNHGLSANAETWQQFCQQQAKQMNIFYQSFSVNIIKRKQQSLEALARDARYSILQQHSDDNSVVITAHHQDDQVETFLLALKRGAGVQGLSAMQPIRAMLTLIGSADDNVSTNERTNASANQQLLARPLLDVSRSSIEEYAQLHQLDWVEDESNTDQSFDRNFIRAQVVPMLNERWPGIKQTIARSADHCNAARSLLEQLAQVDFLHCQISQDCLAINEMANLSDERISNVLRYFIKVNGGQMPTSSQLQQVMQGCFDAAEDKNPEVKLANYSLRRYQDGLYFTDIYTDVSAWQSEYDLNALTGDVTLELPDNLGYLSIQKGKVASFVNTEQVVVKHQSVIELSSSEDSASNGQNQNQNQKILKVAFRHNNPTCLPDYRQHSRPLKKVLQEQGVPTWQRRRIPFIFINNELAATLPLFICKKFALSENPTAQYVTIFWYK